MDPEHSADYQRLWYQTLAHARQMSLVDDIRLVLPLSRCNHSTSLYGTFISNLLAGSVLNTLGKNVPYMEALWFYQPPQNKAVDQTPPLCASVVTEAMLQLHSCILSTLCNMQHH